MKSPVVAFALVLVACGSRTALDEGDPGDPGGVGGGGGCEPCPKPVSACRDDQGVVELAAGLTDPYTLAGDAAALYVGQLETHRPLLRLPKAGGPATALVADVDFAEFAAIDGGTLFFSSQSTLAAVPTSGGPARTVASASGPTGFAILPSEIVLAEYVGHRVLAVDRATLAVRVVTRLDASPYRVAVLGDNVYFGGIGPGVGRVPLAGGVTSVLAPGLGSPHAVLAHDDALYALYPNTMEVSVFRDGSDEPHLVADLAFVGDSMEAFATDGTWFYFTVHRYGGPGAIVRSAIGGGQPEVLFSTPGPQPAALVVDDDCLYFTDWELGAVYRARKP